MSALQQHAQDYLQLRQALGHKMAHAVWLLPKFVAYLDHQGLPTVTTAAAVAWAQATPRQSAPAAQQQRLSIARGFAHFMVGVDPATEIPPTDLLAHYREWRTPFIYSLEDVRALMATARRISPEPFRGATMATLIGLLGVTGMRVGEALRLTDQNVDWDQGILLIHATKFGKSRAVVLDASTLKALGNYVALRNQRVPEPRASQLFVTERGTPVQYPRVGEAFRDALQESGVGARASARPHLHDLRHAFAVRTLVTWYRQGADVEAWLPRLSTYLGHTTPHETYWYLTAVPELLQLAARRVTAWQEGGTE